MVNNEPENTGAPGDPRNSPPQAQPQQPAAYPQRPGDNLDAGRTDYRDEDAYVSPVTGEPAERTVDDGAASTHRDVVVDREPEVVGARMSKFGGYLLGVLRILLGWEFLWAFLDKTFGFGYATPSAAAWIRGGSPTQGFLDAVTSGESKNPFKSFFEIFNGAAWADWLFMIGLLGIGIGLILGIAMWISCIAGAVLLLLMYAASWPIAQNPFLDAHLLDAVVLIALLACNAGAYLGFGRRWKHRLRTRKTREV